MNNAEELREMLNDVADSPPLYRPARFWSDLGEEHLGLLRRCGFDRFKRTVSIRYFNWRTSGILAHQLAAVGLAWARHPNLHVLSARFPRSRVAGIGHTFGPFSAWIYKTYVAMYWDLLRRDDKLHLLDQLEEPTLGDPFLIEHRGHRISQDLCNSIQELYTVFGATGPAILSVRRPLEIADLGAGYGRLGYVVLSAFPLASYTVIDLPPALYLAQRYLTTLFPYLRAFGFRRFDAFDEVRDEFDGCRLRFLTPRQAALLPDERFDHFVTISTLHEMTRAQVTNYLALIDRICRGRVYTKQWRVARVSHDKRPLRQREYPIPHGWRTIFERRHPIQRWFFEALYETRSVSGGSRADP